MHVLAQQCYHYSINLLQQLNQNSEKALTAELCLTRTILERLECSFARQEAKLDRLLSLMTAAPPSVLQTPQCPPQPSVSFSTQFSIRSASSIEYPPPTERCNPPAPRTPLQEIEGLLDNTVTAGKSLISFN